MSDVPVSNIPKVGDRVRELQTNEERYVIEVIDEALIVLADESKGKQSNRRRWLAKNCVIVTRCPFHIDDEVTLGNGNGAPGKIVEIKPHYHGKWLMFCVERPQPSGGTMKNWANAGALHLVTPTSSAPAQVTPVAYDLKETESDGGMKISDLWAQESAADPDTDDPLFRAAQAIVDEQDKVRAAEERAKVAEKLVAKLEAKLREMEVCITQPQPVPVAQAECWQIKTTMFKVGLPDHDKQYTDHLNEGWKESSVTSIVNSSDEIYSVVVFKKMLSTPPQPTRGTAGQHAAMTSPFVSQEMYRARQQQAVAPDAILQPVESKIKLGPIGTSIKEIGRGETSQLMTDFALQKAFAAGAERIAKMPDFNRPLHTLKAGE